MPCFIKIVQREIDVDALLEEISKKNRQFCKETISLLAMWFPKDFYDNTTASWFKKATTKYNIAVKFIVYYTNDKLDTF